jgi:hypothetical protein
LIKQTANLSKQQQSTSKQDRQQATSNPNYLREKGSNIP